MRQWFFRRVVNLWVAAVIGVSLSGSVMAESSKDTIVWWGCAFVEMSLAGSHILIDPFGRTREADVILVTHKHSDHCHSQTLQECINASGGVDLLIGDKGCRGCFSHLNGAAKTVLADRWESFSYRDLTIDTLPSYEGQADIGYFIQRQRDGLGILHLGDNSKYTEDYKHLAGKVDILFLSMGKMTIDQMTALVRDISPSVLVPMHYRPREGNILDPKFDFPSPSEPEQDIADFANALSSAGLGTKVVVLKPGQIKEFGREK